LSLGGTLVLTPRDFVPSKNSTLPLANPGVETLRVSGDGHCSCFTGYAHTENNLRRCLIVTGNQTQKPVNKTVLKISIFTSYLPAYIAFKVAISVRASKSSYFLENYSVFEKIPV
jgi:hypothetical protein